MINVESREMIDTRLSNEKGGKEKADAYRRQEQEQELENQKWEWGEEERLKNKKDSNKCMLTNACIEAKGLPDDCTELTTLRSFRDKYIKSLPNGVEIIDNYYKIAPEIIEKINKGSNSEDTYEYVFGVVTKCVELIQRNENEKALSEYVDMVNTLRFEWDFNKKAD